MAAGSPPRGVAMRKQGIILMTGQMVKFPSNGSTADGYLATPTSGTGPGLIVLQEYWGLVPHIKDVADRFAAEGFVALAPDLYHGNVATHPDEAARMMMAMNIGQTERDLRGAAALLKSKSSTKKIGAIGYCMGGTLAMLAATLNPEYGACITYYGANSRIKPDFSKLNCPVLGMFGATDAYITSAVTSAMEAEIKAAGKSAEFHTYPGAGHAFFNDSRPEAYNKAAAVDAWTRTLTFLRANLS